MDQKQIYQGKHIKLCFKKQLNEKELITHFQKKCSQYKIDYICAKKTEKCTLLYILFKNKIKITDKNGYSFQSHLPEISNYKKTDLIDVFFKDIT